MALTDKLTNIAEAIRSKTGSTALLTLDAMPNAISSIETGSGGGDIDIDPIELTGDCSYTCGGKAASAFIELFPDKVSTSGITDAGYMFSKSNLDRIPFQINIDNAANLSYMFQSNVWLTECPKVRGTIKWSTSTNLDGMLNSCLRLRDIEDLLTSEMLEGASGVKITSTYSCPKFFRMHCLYSLRRLPSWFYAFRYSLESTATPSVSYTPYHQMLYSAYALDEALDVPVYLGHTVAVTANLFQSTLNYAFRLKNFTFELDPNTNAPYEVKWKTQTLDFTNTTGWSSNYYSELTTYNSGITADKEVKDDATYQALKNDPDWFAREVEYCRYNHDSAVETINSLPDTSAYLASAGGTNTIKFKGAAGSSTDGGAINTLTAEEIAVATAKGWTVTLS
jgi:hypothetical protein